MLASPCSSSSAVRGQKAREIAAVSRNRNNVVSTRSVTRSCYGGRAAPSTKATAAAAAAVAASSFLTCRRSRRSSVVVAAAAAEPAAYGAPPATNPEAYIVLGLAHCFEKSSEDGKLVDRMVIEPVSANSLECMAAGGKTSFVEVSATRAGQAMSKDRSAMPPSWSSASFCDDWAFRVGACARTWGRPHAADNLMDLVPLGSPPRGGWNFDLTDKRVLGVSVEVNDDDNIKQDISIDVYGRGDHSGAVDGGLKVAAKSEQESSSPSPSPAAAAASGATSAKSAPAAPPAPVVEPEEEVDELDALLMD